MNRVTNFKIKATVVLTEMPVDVELMVDKVHWLTIDQQAQAKLIWDTVKEQYPLAMDIAILNGNTMTHVSYIDASTIKVS